jgi:ketosteroid isomerase-like protein
VLLAVLLAVGGCGSDGGLAEDNSRAFIDAYNQRDAEAMRAMLAPDIEYVRPGPEVLNGVDEVMARYAEEWSIFDESRVELRTIVESGSTIAAEITAFIRAGDRELEMESAIVHEWSDDLMVRYRAYMDPPPGQ